MPHFIRFAVIREPSKKVLTRIPTPARVHAVRGGSSFFRRFLPTLRSVGIKGLVMLCTHSSTTACGRRPRDDALTSPRGAFVALPRMQAATATAAALFFRTRKKKKVRGEVFFRSNEASLSGTPERGATGRVFTSGSCCHRRGASARRLPRQHGGSGTHRVQPACGAIARGVSFSGYIERRAASGGGRFTSASATAVDVRRERRPSKQPSVM